MSRIDIVAITTPRQSYRYFTEALPNCDRCGWTEGGACASAALISTVSTPPFARWTTGNSYGVPSAIYSVTVASIGAVSSEFFRRTVL
jgi:hypothetical protein